MRPAEGEALVRALVVGDVMLDCYIYGTAERVSPEAPVPVLRVARRDERPGGAANVAAGLAALGAKVTLIGLVGADEAAEKLSNVLLAQGVENAKWIRATDRRTTVKTRLVAGRHHLGRFDEESIAPIDAALEQRAMEVTLEELSKVDVIVLSDYAKGFLTSPFCLEVISAARALGLPVIVDPKGTDYEKYRGAYAVTPNRPEAANALGLPIETLSDARIAARELRGIGAFEYVVITLGEQGMMVADETCEVHLVAEARDVFDVTGAGDVVVVVLALGAATRRPFFEVCGLANRAAAVAVSKFGSVALTWSDIHGKAFDSASFELKICEREEAARRVRDARKSGRRVVFTNGCFDLFHSGHARFLAQARSRGDVVVVALNDDPSVTRLKGANRPVNSLKARSIVIAGQYSVDIVTSFSEDTPLTLIQELEPDVLVKGGDYEPRTVVGYDFVVGRGGCVECLSYHQGESSTSLVSRVLRGARSTNANEFVDDE
jgi:D-beta-D-heptose 7-phosphate kinase/D-beta-D-heptose 1-phosphate adenosyltransferase